jgi:hypothetical protein
MAQARGPKRVQQKRAKGWRMPSNTVRVSRPSPFGNPYVVGKRVNGRDIGDRAHAVSLFRKDYAHGTWRDMGLPSPAEIRNTLRGKNLACWCPLDGPCHADVLLKIANRRVPPRK